MIFMLINMYCIYLCHCFINMYNIYLFSNYRGCLGLLDYFFICCKYILGLTWQYPGFSFIEKIFGLNNNAAIFSTTFLISLIYYKKYSHLYLQTLKKTSPERSYSETAKLYFLQKNNNVNKFYFYIIIVH